MAANKFSSFLTRIFYEEGDGEPAPESTVEEKQEEVPEVTQEEVATFEATISEEGEENVTEMAKKVIIDSQIESDNDDFPDISNVQAVLDSVGTDVNHDVIKNVLKNLVHCEPTELEKDGIGRRQAVLSAIEKIKQKDAALKSEKANDEQSLIKAEKDAEVACTAAISQANLESEQAIEEEKRRSAAIIAQIRQNTDVATEAAKKERDETLESIAAKRAENEKTLRKSAALMAEIEKQGQTIINQIDIWLSYLK